MFTALIFFYRLFTALGEQCQLLVTSNGISTICEKGLSGEPSNNVLRATLKAIAHFARVTHTSCITQVIK